MINERLKSALKWCNEHKVKNQLNLFDQVKEKDKKLPEKDKSLKKVVIIRPLPANDNLEYI